MRTSLQDIFTYIHCPLKYKLGSKTIDLYSNFKETVVGNLYEEIVLKAYHHRFLTGKDIDWGVLRESITKSVLKQDFDLEKALSQLLWWYENNYTNDQRYGIAGLNLNYKLGDHFIVAKIPLILLQDEKNKSAYYKNSVGIILEGSKWNTDKEQKSWITKIYKSFPLKVIMWLVQSYLNIKIDYVEFFDFKQLRCGRLKIMLEQDNEIENFIKNIIKAISMGICYPVLREDCVLCEFNKKNGGCYGT
jgi:hypothetical protein